MKKRIKRPEIFILWTSGRYHRRHMPINRNIFSVIPIKVGITTIYVVGERKIVIIDAGYPGSAKRVLHHLSENAINPGDVSLIIVTHAHIDHYGSAAELRSLTGAHIAVHRDDANDISQGLNRIGIPAGLPARIIKRLFIRTDVIPSKPLKPDIILEDNTGLQPFGVEGRIIHTPGHTPGSVSVVLDSGGAIVGDLLMGGLVFRRAPHLPLFVQDMAALKRSIAGLVQLRPRIVFASHGGPFSESDVQEFARKNVIK